MHLIGYIVLGLAAFILAFQLYAWLDARRARGRKVPTGSAAPGLSIPDHGPALLYFHSPGCMACKPMTPILEALAGERDNVCTINAAEHPEITRAYGIRGTPTLVQLNDGRIVKVLLGARGPKQIRALIDAG